MRLEVGKGMDQYIQMLGNLEYKAGVDIGKAIYAGADIIADAIKANIEKITADDRNFVEGKRNGPTTLQKKALVASFGIAHQRNDNGFTNVKAGFDGYNKVKTKRWPSGQPNAMIARSIESGTSFMKKHPFVSPAVAATKDKAEREMARVIEQQIIQTMK